MGHVLSFALKGLRSAVATSGNPGPFSSTSTSTSTNTSSGENTVVLLGVLQIFGSLYGTHAMCMSPSTYDEVCETILHL